MDTSYYFVLEPNGQDDGPYRLHDIQKRVDVGLISRGASLCKTGDTTYVPLADPRFAEVLQPPKRPAMGTQQVPVTVAPVAAPVAPLVAAPVAPLIVEVAPPAPVIVDVAPPALVAPVFVDVAPLAPTRPSARAASRRVSSREDRPSQLTPPAVAAMPPGFVPPSVPVIPVTAPISLDTVPTPQFTVAELEVEMGTTTAPAVQPQPAPQQYANPPLHSPHQWPQPAPQYANPSLHSPHQWPQPQWSPPPMPQLAAPQHPLPEMPMAPQLAAPELAAPEHPLPEMAMAPQQHHYTQATQMQPPALATPRSPARKKQLAIAAGAVGIVGIGLAVGLNAMGPSSNGAPKDAIVRVTTATGAGTGFLIQGPDRYAYVATANHVVDRGERVLVERDVGADGHSYVEAYPETEVVATDPYADLAIIRIKNVDASRFARLQLATKPSKDERILSYGYPGSSLARKPGLVSKDGKILSVVSFPAYDQRYARILRDNAVDGLLISTDIEQGMSGGPTLNASNQVVGINVTKDRAHVGQNGAVSVVALRELVARIKPAAQVTDPKPEDVVALLVKLQTEYLLLPVDERSRVRETDFVHPGDLPNLRNLVGEVRREERNTDTKFIAKYSLSGQAALGMYFARLPGKLLETYRAPSTLLPLTTCELSSQRLTNFLGDLTTPTDAPKTGANSCDELAVRPLAWDLAAATLQWDGKEKSYTVTKLERMDEDGQVFRASLRISGAPNLVELWLGVEQDRVRLKLFDAAGNLYAIKSARSVPASSFQGTWSVKRPRVTDTVNKDAEIEATETVSISITDDRKVSIRNVVSEHYFTAASGRGSAFRCSGKRTIDTGLVQSFTGTLDNGVILAFPDKTAEQVGADGTYCKPSHSADRIVAIKLEGEQLTFIRTDGNAYPETVQLRKDSAAAPVAGVGAAAQ